MKIEPSSRRFASAGIVNVDDHRFVSHEFPPVCAALATLSLSNLAYRSTIPWYSILDHGRGPRGKSNLETTETWKETLVSEQINKSWGERFREPFICAAFNNSWPAPGSAKFVSGSSEPLVSNPTAPI